MTIKEYIDYYKGRKKVCVELLEQRQPEIIEEIKKVRDYQDFEKKLTEALDEVKQRIKLVEQYDLIINVLEAFKGEDK